MPGYNNVRPIRLRPQSGLKTDRPITSNAQSCGGDNISVLSDDQNILHHFWGFVGYSQSGKAGDSSRSAPGMSWTICRDLSGPTYFIATATPFDNIGGRNSQSCASEAMT